MYRTAKIIIVMYINKNERDDPKGQSFADLNCLSIIFPIICESAPPSKSGMIKVPRHGIKTNIMPEIIAGLIIGKMILKNVWI
jgi:hypothetical protein